MKKIIVFALVLCALVFSVYLVINVIPSENDGTEIYCNNSTPHDLILNI